MSVDEMTLPAQHGNTSELLSATERALAALWSEILQIELPSANDDFFLLGGDSMTMVMAEFRIMEEFHARLPAGSLLSARTVRSLSALIDEKSSEEAAPENQSMATMPT